MADKSLFMPPTSFSLLDPKESMYMKWHDNGEGHWTLKIDDFVCGTVNPSDDGSQYESRTFLLPNKPFLSDDLTEAKRTVVNRVKSFSRKLLRERSPKHSGNLKKRYQALLGTKDATTP